MAKTFLFKAWAMLITALVLVGCSTTATLAVYSQPEGAYITEIDTNKAFGIAPVVIEYDSQMLRRYRDRDGCFLVKGLKAQWVSGAVAREQLIRLCGSEFGSYTYVLTRSSAYPNLEKDLEFALKVQTMRAEQAQAEASRNAAAAALFSAYMASKPVNCTSALIGEMVSTTCR